MNKKVKISKIKGRAMLYWVGKKPIDVVENYPAQLVETINTSGKSNGPSYDSLDRNWDHLLFHGDNKEVLSTLLVNGFRDKVDLIYIDPPFDSGADYVRKVELRGTREKVEGVNPTTLEQVQYEDIWANDNYLQFIYERLILLRELLSERGSIYLHCDWHKSHHLRALMDEVFGGDNFINEIIWCYSRPSIEAQKTFTRLHDNIFWYAKNKKSFISKVGDVRIPYSERTMERNKYAAGGSKYAGGTTERKVHDEGKIPEDYWYIPMIVGNAAENASYPTQKPSELLERIIKASSEPNSIVLDCFLGSGTTAEVAQRLGRRWIGSDINKGAIQTTMKRLQKTITKPAAQGPVGAGILHYRVNNYDFQDVNALRGIITEKYGIALLKTDLYFDGIVGGKLVKIVELNRPVTKLDVQGVIDELKNRPEEGRNILLIGSGVELSVESMLIGHNKLRPVNKIEARDIQTDGVIVYDPAEADIDINRSEGKVEIVVNDYISPTLIRRLDLDRSVFGERIKDFRSQIDVVLVDTNYDGETFNIIFSDIPAKKKDLIAGKYELIIPDNQARVAVKIIDMLGEETLVVN